MINNKLKPCCMKCSCPDIKLDNWEYSNEYDIDMCSTNIYCSHQAVCKFYDKGQTNRDYIESLSNEDLANYIYHKIMSIGMLYTDSVGGVAKWLGEEHIVAPNPMFKEDCK